VQAVAVEEVDEPAVSVGSHPPVATGQPAWDAFRYVREVMRWMEETSKGVLSQPLTNAAALAGLYPAVNAPAPDKKPRKVA